jgi:hypothetical protein
LVEHQLPKLRVAGSNPVSRSNLEGRNPVAWSPWVPAFSFPDSASGSNRVANSRASVGRDPPSSIRPERSAFPQPVALSMAPAKRARSRGAPADRRRPGAAPLTGSPPRPRTNRTHNHVHPHGSASPSSSSTTSLTSRLVTLNHVVQELPGPVAHSLRADGASNPTPPSFWW